MPELRAYALAVVELRAMVTGGSAEQERFRTLAREALAPASPPAVRDLLGPIHRRVPGAAVVRDDDPTRADLEALLAGSVPRPRAAAAWRLVEAVVTRAARGSTRVPDVDLPRGLLAPIGLPVPPAAGLTPGWCTTREAAGVPGLRQWLEALGVASDAEREEGRPEPDVIAFLDGRA